MATYDYDYIEKEDVATPIETGTGGSIVIGIDFSSGLAIMSNNDLKRIDNAEALLQNVLKYLHTEKDRYKIYSHEYSEGTFGTSIYETIGYTYTKTTLSKYSKEIKSFLLSKDTIKTVNSVEVYAVNDKLLVDINIETIYGRLEVKEVIDGNPIYNEGK